MDNYETLLEAALLNKASYLDTTLAPQLKNAATQIQLTYQSFYDMLINKGVIRADPYRDEKKIQELTLPSSEVFTEPQRQAQMSQRLSELKDLYDNIVLFYDFTSEKITLRSLKKINDVLSYLNWRDFSAGSNHYMTAQTALLVEQTRSTGMSSGLLFDLSRQLAGLVRKMQEHFGEFTSYAREQYKDSLVKNFFGKISFVSNANYNKAQDNFVALLRKEFSKNKNSPPYYKELVIEAIDTLYSPQADKLQQDVLGRLSPKVATADTPAPVKKVVEKNPKQSLFMAFSELARAASSLETLHNKLEANDIFYRKAGLSMGKKLVFALKSFVVGHSDMQYKVDYTDSNTGQKHKKNLVFYELSDKMDDKENFLKRFVNNNSPAFQRLNEMEEKHLEELLNTQINDLREILVDCLALDDFFRSFKSGGKGQIKGIKIEVANIRTMITKATELRYEYVSERSSQVNMKSLKQ
jgi:hypothetical protein